MDVLRHVVITGASSGLGAALASYYAERGAALTLLGRDEARLARVAGSCRVAGGPVRSHVCDVTDAAGLLATLRSADDDRPIDIVVANAGIGGGAVLAPSTGETPALARSIIDVNTLGVVNTVSPLIERFLARRRGHIVIVSSVMAYQGLAEAPVYAASKAAARIYGQGLRRLLGEHGVTVTVACPGFVATPMSATLPFTGPFMVTAEEAARRIAAAVDRGRAETVFPWQMRALATAAQILPPRLVDRILAAGKAMTIGSKP